MFEGDAQRAVHAVNTEANDPTACAVVPTAYIRGRELAMVRTKYGAFRIVRILVLGVVAEAGYQAAAPAVFFSVVKIEEYDV